MNFEFKCPQCGQMVEADESFRGQVAQCPHCGKGIVVPRVKPKLGVARNAGIGGRTETSSHSTQNSSIPSSTPIEQVAIPERLACPTPDQLESPNKSRTKGWIRKLLVALLVILGVATILGGISYGSYLYFGDLPRLERGIAHYEKKAYSKALKLLLPLAEKGYARAQLYVGDCYANGNGVVMDTAEAVKWYRAAADQELPDAQHRMYKCCFDGVGIKRNVENAAKWCRKAADAGFVEAMFDMGTLYDEGLGVEQNAKSVFKWHRKGAEQGYPPSLYQFGLCYKLGIGTNKDEDEASKWQNKAVSAWRASANAGDTEAMIRLGGLYMNGDVVELDKEKAVEWYRKAAEAGSAFGQSSLAVCYIKGEGVDKDNEEAAKWMLKSAEQGVDRESQWAMGFFYYDGIGVAKDVKEAVKWLERSAIKGFPKAKYSLALCYFRGDGVEKDVVKAEKLLEEAADAGDKDAKKELNRIKEERAEKARKLAQEKAEKEKEISKLSDVEDKIEELKERINNILKGRQGGDWAGFDASKITMTDAALSVVEEQPLKRLSGNLSEKDTMEKIGQLILAAQKDEERLQERVKEIARVKKLYDVKELESRKETCAPCSGTGMVSCTRCKGTGEVTTRESLPCPTCCDDTYGKQKGEGQIAKEVVCGYCRGRGDVTVKCRNCNGRGWIKGSGRDMSGKLVLDDRVECPQCEGKKTGTRTCSKCSGNGRVTVWEKCSTCGGKGVVANNKQDMCPVCKGKCKFKCEHCGGRGFTYRPKEGTPESSNVNDTIGNTSKNGNKGNTAFEYRNETMSDKGDSFTKSPEKPPSERTNVKGKDVAVSVNSMDPVITSSTNDTQKVNQKKTTNPTPHEIDPHNPKSGNGISYSRLVEIQDNAITKAKQDKTRTLSSFCGVVFGEKPDSDSSIYRGTGDISLPWGDSKCENYWNSKTIAHVQYTPETYKIARISVEPIDKGMGYQKCEGNLQPNQYLQEFLDGLSQKYRIRPYYLLPDSKYSIRKDKGEFMFPLGDTSVYIHISPRYEYGRIFECIHDKYVELGMTETKKINEEIKDERFKSLSKGDFLGFVLGEVYTKATYDPSRDYSGSGCIIFSHYEKEMGIYLECFATCISKRLVKIVARCNHGVDASTNTEAIFFELCEMTSKKYDTKVTWDKAGRDTRSTYTAEVKKGDIEIQISRGRSRAVMYTIVHKEMERLAEQELQEWKRNQESGRKSAIRKNVDSL